MNNVLSFLLFVVFAAVIAVFAKDVLADDQQEAFDRIKDEPPTVMMVSPDGAATRAILFRWAHESLGDKTDYYYMDAECKGQICTWTYPRVVRHD